ncbi:retinol dehydrogenase 7-like isoform X3 [Periplaneta americana]|uniref:retinol dehydrogenase 7-like isoform X3 n=1 Tax=Periplaneta americana TaxID=6978 RepID=UPI0037E87457
MKRVAVPLGPTRSPITSSSSSWYFWRAEPYKMNLLGNMTKKMCVFGALCCLLHMFIGTNFIQSLLIILVAFDVTGNILDMIWYFTPKHMLPDIQDKVVIVTGCDTGFGHEFAKKLDSLGVLVFAGCLYSEGDGARALKDSCSDKLKIIQLDVTQDDQVENAVKTVTSILEETKQGHFTFPLCVNYCMSKHALVSFSNGLRQELKKWFISVHTIEPWGYRTSILNESQIDSFCQNNWDNTSKTVQREYGEGYLDEVKRTIKEIMTSGAKPMSAVHEVVDALTHATVGKDPKMCYVPSFAGFLLKVGLSILPTELFNILMYNRFHKIDNSKPQSKKMK